MYMYLLFLLYFDIVLYHVFVVPWKHELSSTKIWIFIQCQNCSMVERRLFELFGLLVASKPKFVPTWFLQTLNLLCKNVLSLWKNGWKVKCLLETRFMFDHWNGYQQDPLCSLYKKLLDSSDIWFTRFLLSQFLILTLFNCSRNIVWVILAWAISMITQCIQFIMPLWLTVPYKLFLFE